MKDALWTSEVGYDCLGLGGYVFTAVSLCVHQQDYAKTAKLISTTLGEKIGTRKNSISVSMRDRAFCFLVFTYSLIPPGIMYGS